MRWKLSFLIIFIVLLITGCGDRNKTTSSKTGPSVFPNIGVSDVFDQNEITNNAKKAALSYQDIIDSVPDYPDVSFIIPDDKMKQIIARISALGDPVLAHDFNLQHSEQMLNFYKAIMSGKEAELAVFQIDTDGSLIEYVFKYQKGRLYMTTVGASWSYSSKQLSVGEIDFAYIDKFMLTNNGYFLYHVICTKPEQDYANGFRVKPLPDENWSLYKKYIEPVGYLGNNLFVTNWNKSTISRLNFNDMFQYIYNLEYHQDPDFQAPYQTDPETLQSFISAVPAKDFEKIITKYFPVKTKELRQVAVYDSAKQVYPFNDLFIDDDDYYFTGEVIVPPSAEVVNAQTNKDGSITMVVDVPDLNNYSDCGIRHVLTVMPQKDGSFQYISNTVTMKNYHKDWFWYYTPRITKSVLKQ